MLQITREDFLYDNIVQNRNHLENRGFHPWETCHIRKWLKNHDENLDIFLNERTRKARIVDDTLHCIMEVDADTVSYATVERIKQIDSRSGWSALKEVERSEAIKEYEHEKKMEDLAYNLAKDTHKSVRDFAYYGR